MTHRIKAVQYSQLKYENINPYLKGRGKKCRVWFLEYQRRLFWRELALDLLKLYARTMRLICRVLKREYRKEFLVALIVTLSWTMHSGANALSTTESIDVKPVVNQPVIPPPPFIKHIALEKPVAAASFDPIPAPAQPVAIPTPPPTPPPATAPQNSSGCVSGYTTGNYYEDHIIAHESGGNSCSLNYLGCWGLMQACPGAPLKAVCGGDPACQLDWFWNNKVANDPKYGSWAAVWQHELDFGWW